MAELGNIKETQIIENSKSQILADLYLRTHQQGFDPGVLQQSSPEVESFRKEMATLLRNGLVNLFLGHYIFQGGKKPIDGVSYEGETYGKNAHDKQESGQKPVVIPWQEVPSYLGFERFLQRKVHTDETVFFNSS